MKVINVTVQITIDEDNISALYPDFPIIFGTVDEFIESVYDSIETEPETLDELGYEVIIKPTKHILPIEYSLN